MSSRECGSPDTLTLSGVGGGDSSKAVSNSVIKKSELVSEITDGEGDIRTSFKEDDG